MNTKEIIDRLDGITASDDFAARSSKLADEWSQAEDGFTAVEPILRFMELHPTLDFGMPGPLVHFVERYYGRGYEHKLLDSLGRKPTSHTVWMLNRVINGTKEPGSRRRLIEIMKDVRDNPATDGNACNIASRFLARLLA